MLGLFHRKHQVGALLVFVIIVVEEPSVFRQGALGGRVVCISVVEGPILPGHGNVGLMELLDRLNVHGHVVHIFSRVFHLRVFHLSVERGKVFRRRSLLRFRFRLLGDIVQREKFVMQSFVSRDPIFGVLLKHFLKEVRASRAYILPARST